MCIGGVKEGLDVGDVGGGGDVGAERENVVCMME